MERVQQGRIGAGAIEKADFDPSERGTWPFERALAGNLARARIAVPHRFTASARATTHPLRTRDPRDVHPALHRPRGGSSSVPRGFHGSETAQDRACAKSARRDPSVGLGRCDEPSATQRGLVPSSTRTPSHARDQPPVGPVGCRQLLCSRAEVPRRFAVRAPRSRAVSARRSRSSWAPNRESSDRGEVPLEGPRAVHRSSPRARATDLERTLLRSRSVPRAQQVPVHSRLVSAGF